MNALQPPQVTSAGEIRGASVGVASPMRCVLAYGPSRPDGAVAMPRHGNVVPIGLSPIQGTQLVREVAQDSGRVFFTHHAERKMRERHITRTQVLRCLTRGSVVEGPSRDVKGNWTMKLEALSAGELIAVVAALDRDEAGNSIIVITVY
jgi:hypothetical protein